MIGRLAYPLVLFISGLGVGVLWSPRGGSSQIMRDNLAVSDVQSENEKYLEKIGEMCGKEAAEFVEQSKDMTMQIREISHRRMGVARMADSSSVFSEATRR